MFTISWARDISRARTRNHTFSWSSGFWPLCHCCSPGSIHSFIPLANIYWFLTTKRGSYNVKQNIFGQCFLELPDKPTGWWSPGWVTSRGKAGCLEAEQREGPTEKRFHTEWETVLWTTTKERSRRNCVIIEFIAAVCVPEQFCDIQIISWEDGMWEILMLWLYYSISFV